MKVTVENNVEKFILESIATVCIGFDDNTEVTLREIMDYDIDLDKIESSTIGLTNAFTDVEIENHFRGYKRNQIIYVHIYARGVDNLSGERLDVFYDIPCDMVIRKLRINGGNREIGSMFIELEGFIR